MARTGFEPERKANTINTEIGEFSPTEVLGTVIQTGVKLWKKEWSHLHHFVSMKDAQLLMGFPRSQTSPRFCVSAVQVFRKHFGKRRNCS